MSYFPSVPAWHWQSRFGLCLSRLKTKKPPNCVTGDAKFSYASQLPSNTRLTAAPQPFGASQSSYCRTRCLARRAHISLQRGVPNPSTLPQDEVLPCPGPGAGGLWGHSTAGEGLRVAGCGLVPRDHGFSSSSHHAVKAVNGGGARCD